MHWLPYCIDIWFQTSLIMVKEVWYYGTYLYIHEYYNGNTYELHAYKIITKLSLNNNKFNLLRISKMLSFCLVVPIPAFNSKPVFLVVGIETF